MLSFRNVWIGFGLLPCMFGSTQAEVLDQLRMASVEPFIFSITPASPLPAVPQVPVDRAPLSANPATPPAAPADTAVQPAGDDTGATSKKHHDEDAARAGLHVAPSPETNAATPADHATLSKMSPAKLAPPETGRFYTPVASDFDALIRSVTRPERRPPQSAEPAVETTAVNAPPPAAQPVTSVPPAPAFVESPAPTASPPSFPAVAPTNQPQVIVVQVLPYPPPYYAPAPMVVYVAPARSPVPMMGSVASAVPTTMPRVARAVVRPWAPAYQQLAGRSPMWFRQRQMVFPWISAYRYPAGGYGGPASNRTAFSRLAVRGVWVGGYR